jgi:hypothetical protein
MAFAWHNPRGHYLRFFELCNSETRIVTLPDKLQPCQIGTTLCPFKMTVHHIITSLRFVIRFLFHSATSALRERGWLLSGHSSTFQFKLPEQDTDVKYR